LIFASAPPPFAYFLRHFSLKHFLLEGNDLPYSVKFFSFSRSGGFPENGFPILPAAATSLFSKSPRWHRRRLCFSECSPFPYDALFPDPPFPPSSEKEVSPPATPSGLGLKTMCDLFLFAFCTLTAAYVAFDGGIFSRSWHGPGPPSVNPGPTYWIYHRAPFLVSSPLPAALRRFSVQKICFEEAFMCCKRLFSWLPPLRRFARSLFLCGPLPKEREALRSGASFLAPKATTGFAWA